MWTWQRHVDATARQQYQRRRLDSTAISLRVKIRRIGREGDKVDDEQPGQRRIEPPGEEIVDQGLDDDRVLRRPLDHGQDMLVAVAIDADRRHQDMVADMQLDLDDPAGRVPRDPRRARPSRSIEVPKHRKGTG